MTAPEPDFEVLGARRDAAAAVPTVALDVAVTDPAERLVFTIALTAQVHIEPSRRTYDSETRAELDELFGPAGGASPGSFLWLQAQVLVPSFTGRHTFAVPLPIGYDHEVAATRYCGALRDGEIPLQMHFSGTTFYRADEGRLQMVQVPWTSARYDLPVSVWRETVDAIYPNGSWIAVSPETRTRLAAVRAAEGLHSFDAAIARLLG